MVNSYVTPARYNVSRTIATRPNDICYTSFPKVPPAQPRCAAWAWRVQPAGAQLLLLPWHGAERLLLACGCPVRNHFYMAWPSPPPAALQSGSTWLANVLYLILHDGVEPEDKPLRANLHWMESAWTFPRRRVLEQQNRAPAAAAARQLAALPTRPCWAAHGREAGRDALGHAAVTSLAAANGIPPGSAPTSRPQPRGGGCPAIPAHLQEPHAAPHGARRRPRPLPLQVHLREQQASAGALPRTTACTACAAPGMRCAPRPWPALRLGRKGLHPSVCPPQIARNPKDVCVSYFHFESNSSWSGGYNGG